MLINKRIKKTMIMVLFVLGALLNLSFYLYSILDGKPGMNNAIKNGEYYYYSNLYEGIYSYNTETKVKTKLSDFYASSSEFHLYKGWVYFSRHRTSDVYRLRTDGTEFTQILK